MPLRLTWTQTGEWEHRAPSFRPGDDWVVYKEEHRWHARLRKRPIRDKNLRGKPQDFGSLHAAKCAAEDLDARLAARGSDQPDTEGEQDGSKD